MPQPDFYAFEPGEPARRHGELQAICNARDAAAWAAWFDRFDRCVPDSLPGDLPITRTQRHAGLPDLVRESPPDPASPSLEWALRQFMMASAAAHHRIRDDGFNGAFADGLNIASRLTTDAQRTAYRLYIATMLMPPRQSFPEAARFLHHPDAFCTYLAAGELRRILDADDAAGFMTALVHSLRPETSWLNIYADLLTDWKKFLRDVADSGRDLFYIEWAT
jgi:hypothetical protein